MSMTVEELFRQLSYGELSNLAIAVEATGAIKKTQQNRIIHFANEALMRLHTRFPLSESSVMVTIAGESMQETLPEGTLLVRAILTEQGDSVSFTNMVSPKGIYVQGNVLNIPIKDLLFLAQNDQLQVLLQMRHPVLQPIVLDTDLAQDITLLPELHEALTAYIASKLYSTMNSPDSAAAAANYQNRYETVCAEALIHGIVPSELQPSLKFEARGWV